MEGFAPDETPWRTTVVTDDTPIGADELLAEAYRLFDSSGLELEWVSEDNLEGVLPSDHFRAHVKTTGTANPELDATLEVWTDASSSGVDIVWLLYNALVARDVQLNGRVAGTESRQTFLFISDEGVTSADSMEAWGVAPGEIEPPSSGSSR